MVTFGTMVTKATFVHCVVWLCTFTGCVLLCRHFLLCSSNGTI
jgi:hypothetical protein